MLLCFTATADLPVRNLADEISKVDCSTEKAKGQISTTSPVVANAQKETAGKTQFYCTCWNIC